MILHQPKQRRRLWASGLVDAEGHRHGGCHHSAIADRRRLG
jgi:hypothetical protein